MKQSKLIEEDIKLVEEKLELITKTYRDNIKMIKRNDYWINLPIKDGSGFVFIIGVPN